jgi:hypothetical protein
MDLAAIFMAILAFLGLASSADDRTLERAYYDMHDHWTCAGLDPRTDMNAFAQEVARTKAILELAKQNGLGAEVAGFEQKWIEADGYVDKICAFQLAENLNQTEPSLQTYQETNDALENAVLAQDN